MMKSVTNRAGFLIFSGHVPDFVSGSNAQSYHPVS